MAQLVLGPLLRYVGDTEATVWVETDAPCEVDVLGHRTPTWCVEGHHYAIVVVRGLAPGSETTYEVRLDGELRWPVQDSPFPPSRIRTVAPGDAVEIVFGSCRVTAPHEPPWTLSKDDDERGLEWDALHALATRMRAAAPVTWPHKLLMLGDQVYVDEGSPETRERIRRRRAVDVEPGTEVADFEEYTWLYHEAWGEPTLRWLLSTISTAMIWDDHDMHDDWNISSSWVREMRRRPWWRERITGGVMSYWVYQHLGNLSPAELDRQELFDEVRRTADAGPALREFAHRAEHESQGTRWSWCRDVAGVRVVCMDSRAGRVLHDTRHGDHHQHRRAMVDDHEWSWIEEHALGDVDHLVLASSLPVFLPPGLQHFEAFSEALCDGAWGRTGTRVGERLRRAADLESWAAFQDSLRRVERLIEEVAQGRRGRPPATITIVSGDVHHAYLAEICAPGDSRVFQATCSPFRNALDRHERTVLRHIGCGRLGTAVARVLARSARVQRPVLPYRIAAGPWFDNQFATLSFEGRRARVTIDRTGADSPGIDRTFERQLA